MKGDPPAAAVRLASSLPSRTHRKPEPVRKEYVKNPRAGRQETRGNKGKSVRIRGTVYPHIKAARIALRVGKMKIRSMLASGEAEYVEA